MKKATFAAGCFWGVQDAFDQVAGVESTTAGYTGGHTENPSYEDVCTDETGHAEAVEVAFDPDKVSYDELLAVFWDTHDPTQFNRQGPDVGSQYRSAIYYHDEEQKKRAEASLKKRQKEFDRPVVTEIEPAGSFYPAEDYHQHYHQKHKGVFCGIPRLFKKE